LLLGWVGQGTLEGKRADPTASNNQALWLAARKGHMEVVRVLLAWEGLGKSVDPTAGNNQAVESAAEKGHVDMVQLLLGWVGQGTLEGKRVDPTAVENCAVRLAAEEGQLEVVQVLLGWVGKGPLEGKRVDPRRRKTKRCGGQLKTATWRWCRRCWHGRARGRWRASGWFTCPKQ
jgi:hypothetical protein